MGNKSSSVPTLDLSQAPYDVMVHILSFVDHKTQAFSCRLVNSQWRAIVESESLRKHAIILKRVPKHFPVFPWYFYYHCLNVAHAVFERNLMTNPCGYERHVGWCMATNIDQWRIVQLCELDFCMELPEEAIYEMEEPRRSHISSFSSRGTIQCANYQVIDLKKHKITRKFMDGIKPVIKASVWFAPEFYGNTDYKFFIELLDSKRRVLQQSDPFTARVESKISNAWKKAKIYMEDYMDGVRYINFVHEAVDSSTEHGTVEFRGGCSATCARVVLTLNSLQVAKMISLGDKSS